MLEKDKFGKYVENLEDEYNETKIVYNKNFDNTLTLILIYIISFGLSILNILTLIAFKMFDVNIWLWTGNTMEQISNSYSEILNYVDVIVDGKYEKINQLRKIGVEAIINTYIKE